MGFSTRDSDGHIDFGVGDDRGGDDDGGDGDDEDDN